MGLIYLLLAFAFSTVIVDKVFSGIIERQQYLSEKSDHADSNRSLIWEMALDGYEGAPMVDKIFGGGPGTGARYVQLKAGWFVMPHNGFIEVMCDYGIVGLALYIAFFITLLIVSLKHPRGSIERKMLLGITVAWIMSNLVSHAGRVWAMYCCIALGYILCHKKTDDVETNIITI